MSTRRSPASRAKAWHCLLLVLASGGDRHSQVHQRRQRRDLARVGHLLHLRRGSGFLHPGDEGAHSPSIQWPGGPTDFEKVLLPPTCLRWSRSPPSRGGMDLFCAAHGATGQRNPDWRDLPWTDRGALDSTQTQAPQLREILGASHSRRAGGCREFIRGVAWNLHGFQFDDGRRRRILLLERDENAQSDPVQQHDPLPKLNNRHCRPIRIPRWL